MTKLPVVFVLMYDDNFIVARIPQYTVFVTERHPPTSPITVLAYTLPNNPALLGQWSDGVSVRDMANGYFLVHDSVSADVKPKGISMEPCGFWTGERGGKHPWTYMDTDIMGLYTANRHIQ